MSDSHSPVMQKYISIRGAREHNLKNLNLKIPLYKLVVVTGVSGSGKSSLAFDILYAEGQRRFFDTLPSYSRYFMGQFHRPDVDTIDGIPPVVAISQKSTHYNPRSTVGTTTEIYDLLRLLYARAGTPYSYISGKPLSKLSHNEIFEHIMKFPSGTKIYCLAPKVRKRKGHYNDLFCSLLKKGYIYARIDTKIVEITTDLSLERYKQHDIELVIDRLIVSANNAKRIQKSVFSALKEGDGIIILQVELPDKTQFDKLYSTRLYDPEADIAYSDPEPNLFSFNHSKGMCNTCNGLGYHMNLDEEKLIPNRSQSMRNRAIRSIGEPKNTWEFKVYEAILEIYNCTIDTPIKDYPDQLLKTLLYGSDRLFTISYNIGSQSFTYNQKFKGIKEKLIRNMTEKQGKREKNRQNISQYMSMLPCKQCKGSRLNRQALSYRIDSYSMTDLTQCNVDVLLKKLSELKMNDRQKIIAKPILREIYKRLDIMLKFGLDYLTLHREIQTLSGGEMQRIRLATQIGSQLTGVLYILDEPSIGLHAKDNHSLISSLKSLRDMGNSLIVVEHDRAMIEQADIVIDLGPGAGVHGGELISLAAPNSLPSSSITSHFLLKKEEFVMKQTNSLSDNVPFLKICNARGHNLKNIDVSLPIGHFCCVTGVSGSGKSSLINQTLYPALSRHFYHSSLPVLPYSHIEGIDNLDKVITIDQSPIGRTPRSIPATYTQVFGHIRTLFAEMPLAKSRGYTASHFSFNVKGGRCEECQGSGVKKIEMKILPDVYVECEVCKGKRYNRDILQVMYRNKNISDTLAMTIEEAVIFFEHFYPIVSTLKMLLSIGLGYLTLGQSSTTLSGGEAQRIKLSRELSKKGTSHTLYIMDEPTTGLHFQDVKLLVNVIRKLVSYGNTVVVIEHNIDVIRCCDYIVDIGPEGGEKGGCIVAQGTPKSIQQQKKGYTSHFL